MERGKRGGFTGEGRESPPVNVTRINTAYNCSGDDGECCQVSAVILPAVLCSLVMFLLSAGLTVFSSVLAERTKRRDNRVLVCNFAKYSPILIFFHSQTQQ